VQSPGDSQPECAHAAGSVSAGSRVLRRPYGFFGAPGVDPAWLDGSPLMGVLLMGWIAAQLAMIGSVSWLQPAIFVAGVAITTLAGVALLIGRRRARVGVTA